MGSLVLNLQLDNKDVSKQWTYKDVDTSLTIDETRRNINSSKDIDAVENGIYNMFLFAKGERIINPEFGNSLYQFLYEPINNITAKRIGQAINDMFERWEPRVVIDELIVTPYEDENTYVVEINYRIPTLNNQLLNFTYAVNARR